jgi:predicted phage terminase large subunit-like protein
MYQTSKKSLVVSKKVRYEDLDVSGLNAQERRELQLLLAEAENRDLLVESERLDRSLVKFPETVDGFFYKNDGKPFIPVSDDQKNFALGRGRFALYSGSRGCGKTATASQRALKKIQAGLDGMIINPVFEDFKNSTWQEFKQWIPPESVVMGHRHRLNDSWEPQKPFWLSFLTGANVLCKGLKDPKSARGPNVNWLWYDEGGSDEDGEGWRIANAAVRVGYEPSAWVSSTPNGILHWMYDFFLSEEQKERLQELLKEFGEELGNRPLVEVFHGSIEENKVNLDIGFYAAMQAAYPSGWQKTQEIDGLFVAKSGSLGSSSWFTGLKIPEIPKEITVKNRVRFWDLAASEKKVFGKKGGNDPDKTVGTLLSFARRSENSFVDGSGKEVGNYLDDLPNYKGKDVYFVEEQRGGHWEWKDIKEQIWKTALEDGYYVKVWIEQEPGSGGINQVEEMKLFFQKRCEEFGIPQFSIEGKRPEGDKVMRANIWFAEARDGLIYLITGAWNMMFLRMVDSFSADAPHDDEIDSMSGARIVCAPIKTWKKIAFRKI